MFNRVLDVPLANNLLQLTEDLRRSSSTLVLGKGNLDWPYLLIPLISTKNKKLKPWVQGLETLESHRVLVSLSNTRNKMMKYMVLFHLFFFCPQPFDQEPGPSLIGFFHFRTTIRPKYKVLFQLFFLLQTTIRPKYPLLFHSFFL